MLSVKFHVTRDQEGYYIDSAQDCRAIEHALTPEKNRLNIGSFSLSLETLGATIDLNVERIPVFSIDDINNGIELTGETAAGKVVSIRFSIFGKVYEASGLDLPIAFVVSSMNIFLAGIGI